ncbi:hypothetical protein D3C72_522720 [compost metagenome]
MFDGGAAAEALGLADNYRPHPLQGLRPHLGVQRAQAQAQQCLLRDHVGRFAGLQGADGNHSRLLRIDIARHHGLQGHHHTGRRHQRVDGQVRHRAMTTHPVQGHRQQVLRSHHRPFTKPQVPGRQPGHVVHAEQRITWESLQQAVGQHRLGTALALLGRLEDQCQRAVELPGRRQVARGAKQHGGMPVMAAGVHAALVLAAVRGAGSLVDGQRVHVGAQAQAAWAAAIAQYADHAGLADTGVHFIAPFFEQLGNQRRSAAFFEAQFRVSVDIVTDCVQVAGHIVQPGQDVLMSGHVESPRAGGFPFLLFALRSRRVRQVVLG